MKDIIDLGCGPDGVYSTEHPPTEQREEICRRESPQDRRNNNQNQKKRYVPPLRKSQPQAQHIYVNAYEFQTGTILDQIPNGLVDALFDRAISKLISRIL